MDAAALPAAAIYESVQPGVTSILMTNLKFNEAQRDLLNLVIEITSLVYERLFLRTLRVLRILRVLRTDLRFL